MEIRDKQQNTGFKAKTFSQIVGMAIASGFEDGCLTPEQKEAKQKSRLSVSKPTGRRFSDYYD